MATHRPAHARSGFGRYTAPRRLHPAHAAPSPDGVRITRAAGAIIGGGVLASAGLMGLITTPAGAATISGISPPFSSLGTFVTDPDGSVAGVAGGGGTLLDPAIAGAEAGIGASGNLDNNTAFSFSFGPGALTASEAGAGGHANLSDNTATADATSALGLSGFFGTALAVAGVGTFANLSDNTATAWTYGGFAAVTAGSGTFANLSGNLAWAGSQFSVVNAAAGAGNDAHDVGNAAYAYGLFSPSVGAFAGLGDDGAFSNNLAIAQSTFGTALACAGTGSYTISVTPGASTCAVSPQVESITFTDAPGSNNMATAGSVAGEADAFAEDGNGNDAAASAVGGGASAALADGNGNDAAALGVAGGSADAIAEGTNQSADATAVGAGSTGGALASGGSSIVLATSGLGGWSDASTSGGVWTVSINGGTLVS